MNLHTLSGRPPKNTDKGDIKDAIDQLGEELYQLHTQFMACSDKGLLVVVQGLDAAGKDGLVRRIIAHMNPIGTTTHSFKKPTEEEYSHNFLWRIQRALPPHGKVGFFIRSHYEDILVPGVEGYLPNDVVDRRYNQINQFEALVQDHGMRIVKVFLHVSKEEQEERLNERINLAHKHWKHNDRDWEVRAKREDYLNCYHSLIERCNTPEWNVVPADTNWWKTYAVMSLMVEELKHMKLEWPALESERFSPASGKA